MTVIHVAATVHATEDAERVAQAMRRFFPDAEPVAVPLDSGPAAATDGRPGAVRLVATSQDLATFRRRIWELRIIDAARGQLSRGLAADGASLTARLGKQAALAGHVSFPPRPHALGDIELRLEHKDVAAVLAWLCPETQDGEIVVQPGPEP